MTLGSHEGGQGPSKELHGAHPLSCPLKMEEGRSAPGRGSSPKPATLDPHLSLPASRHPEPPAPPRPAVFGSSTQAGTAGGGCTIIRYAASRVTSSIHGGEAGAESVPTLCCQGCECPATWALTPLPTLGSPAPQTPLLRLLSGQGQDAGRAKPGQKEQQARDSVPEAGPGSGCWPGAWCGGSPRNQDWEASRHLQPLELCCFCTPRQKQLLSLEPSGFFLDVVPDVLSNQLLEVFLSGSRFRLHPWRCF